MALGVATVVGVPHLGGTQATAVASRTYVVRPGDTLWSIASRAAGPDDPRPLVDALERANQISAGELVPGRVIVVPSGG